MWKLAALGLGASLLACSPAQAKTYALGTLSGGGPVAFTSALSTSSVSDILTFSLTTKAGGSFADLVAGVKAKAYNPSTMTGTILVPISSSVEDTLRVTLPAGFSPSSSYYAVVTGIGTGAKGPVYSLSLFNGSPAAPAPGPEGWLVMGAGLGALVLLRRRAAKSAPAASDNLTVAA